MNERNPVYGSTPIRRDGERDLDAWGAVLAKALAEVSGAMALRDAFPHPAGTDASYRIDEVLDDTVERLGVDVYSTA